MTRADRSVEGPGSNSWKAVQYLSALFSDNQNVVRILYIGSKKVHLQSVALKIFSLSVCAQIKIEAKWIPRELNLKADLLSGLVDLDDWILNPVMFAELDRA